MVADEEAQEQNLHVLFFPLFARGHMIPLFDIARLLASQDGVLVTFVTTPINAPLLTGAAVNKSDQKDAGHSISNKCSSLGNVNLEIIPLPYEEVGLSPDFKNTDSIVDGNDIVTKLFKAFALLKEPLIRVIDRLNPNCLVSDLLLPWTSDVANHFNIPRLGFHGSSCFSMSALEVLWKESCKKTVSSDEQEFEIPGGFPDKVTITRAKLPPGFLQEDRETPMMKLLQSSYVLDKGTVGVILNTFYAVESKYVDYYREVLGKKSWTVGPVSMYNRSITDKANRGKKGDIDEQECLNWLDSKPPSSVIYISFGSAVTMISAQLREIAIALEASQKNFIWIVSKTSTKQEEEEEVIEEEEEDWLPDREFEKRNKGKGLIIRGWAPQVMILDHQAVGAFVTHCGWNSTLEGLAAGVPMVTWPIYAEQFLNEKLLTQIIKTGVSVGAKRFWYRIVEEVDVDANAIKKAIQRIMVGDEATEIRKRAEEVKNKAWRAIEVGGSSHQGLNDLLTELRSYK